MPDGDDLIPLLNNGSISLDVARKYGYLPPNLDPLGQQPVQQAVTGLAQGAVQPVLDAGNYLGGLMQGSQRFNWPDVVKYGGGLAIAGIGPKIDRMAGALRIPLNQIEHGEAALPGGTLFDRETPALIQQYAKMKTDFPPIEAFPPDQPGGKWMIYDGSRRYEAAKLRGDKDIRVVDPTKQR